MDGLQLEALVRDRIAERERLAAERRRAREVRRSSRTPGRSWVVAGTLAFWHPRG